jgi:hypothetical protein
LTSYIPGPLVALGMIGDFPAAAVIIKRHSTTRWNAGIDSNC